MCELNPILLLTDSMIFEHRYGDGYIKKKKNELPLNLLSNGIYSLCFLCPSNLNKFLFMGV